MTRTLWWRSNPTVLARLRFGDDINGMRPEPDSVFTAAYRLGNGTAGNRRRRYAGPLHRPAHRHAAPIRCPLWAARIRRPPTRFAAARPRPS